MLSWQITVMPLEQIVLHLRPPPPFYTYFYNLCFNTINHYWVSSMYGEKFKN